MEEWWLKRQKRNHVLMTCKQEKGVHVCDTVATTNVICG